MVNEDTKLLLHVANIAGEIQQHHACSVDKVRYKGYTLYDST